MKVFKPMQIATSIAVLAWLIPSTPTDAVEPQAGSTITLNIAPQPLSDALSAFAQQSGLQVVFYADVGDGIVSPELAGTFSPQTALTRLLENSSLQYEFINPRTVAIRPSKGGGVDTAGSAGASRVGADGLSLARADDQSEDRQKLGSSGAGAQDLQRAGSAKDSQATRIEEIVVTAQKREQRAFDVPISIVAMGGDELEKRRITSLEDLSFAVPGLAIQNNGAFHRRITLRGIGNVFGQGSLIGMYLDEASVTSNDSAAQLDMRTYDLERVEVLRGPQGTLYGDGSVGGTIRLITKNPSLDQFGMKGDVAALYTEDGEPGQRIQAAFDVPLIENELGLRIAGTHDRQGGWIDQPAASRKDFNDQDLTNVRIKGLWRPVPQFTLNAMAVIHRNDASFTSGEDAEGNYTQTFDFTTSPRIQDDYDLFNLTLTYDFPVVRLLSTTTHLERDREFSGQGATFPFDAPPAPLWHYYVLRSESNVEILSQEFRLTSIGSGPLQWTVGGYYRDVKTRSDGDALFGLPGIFVFQFGGPNSGTSKSWAAFGDMSYDVTDRLTLGTGLRYFEDEHESAPGPTFDIWGFHSVNPRFYAQYKLTDRVNTYTSAAKGFRSGGYNGFALPKYQPETVWTYELGAKMSLAGGRVTFDTAVFYSDYTNYQINGFDPLVGRNFISNAGDATIKGIEWGLAWRPGDQWTLSVNGNYVDTELVKVDVSPSSYAVGDQLPMVPKLGITISAQRDFTWNGKSGFSRLDYNEHSRSSFRDRSTGPWYFSYSDVISMLNLNVGLQWNKTLSLGFFGQNLLNDRGYADPFSIEGASRSRPRTYGIEFGVNFD